MAFLSFKILVLIAFLDTSLAQTCLTFTSDSNFKVEWYTGVWYEVYRLPNFFQVNTKCVNATYTLNADGTVKVFNQGLDAQGQYESIEGVATVIDPAVPGSFELNFGGAEPGSYNVLETDYQRYSVVYSCKFFSTLNSNIELAYIISRDKVLEENKLRKAMRVLTDIGFDTTRLIPIVQDC